MLICSVFLYYMPYPNFLHHLTQCQKLSFQSGLVETFLFPLLGLYSQIIEIFFFFPEVLLVFFFFFHYFSQISHLNFYCTMCCSSVHATFSLQVSQRHMHPSLQKNKPKQKIHQVLNSNSAFIFLVLMLLTSDFRAGFYVALYPV